MRRHGLSTVCGVLLALAATACGPLTNLFGDECSMRPVGLVNFRVAATSCDEFVAVDGEGPYYVRGMSTSITADDLRPAGKITGTTSFDIDGDVFELNGVDPEEVLVTVRSDEPDHYILLIREAGRHELPESACAYLTNPDAVAWSCGE